MSMLAERKQKQRWCLNPRGKLWSEDSNKFGQKMLEKMGWKRGKGLGAKEDGNTEHIKVSYKNDSKGMGYKENTEQWTEHDELFNGLLKNLNGDSNDGDDNIKVNSLHKIAETTKTRINYHKFTKGKDLSRYSEKDLANIFGKKSLTEKPKPEEPIEEKKLSVIVESDNLVERGSMTDYFKKKLPNFGKKQFGLKIGSNGVLTKDSDSECERPSFGLGFISTEDKTSEQKGKKRKYEESFAPEDSPQKMEEEELPKSTKKKKSKKPAENVSYLKGNSNKPLDLEEKEIVNEPNRKKKKKKGTKEESMETDIRDIEDLVVATSCEKKKKKKPKTQQNDEKSKHCDTALPSEQDKVSSVQSEEVIMDLNMTPSGERKKKKKLKKNGEITAPLITDIKAASRELQSEEREENTATAPSSVQNKKKSKKLKNDDTIEDTTTPSCKENSKISKKLRNKERNKNIANNEENNDKLKLHENISEENTAISGKENNKKSERKSNNVENEELIEQIAAPSSDENKKKLQNQDTVEDNLTPASAKKKKKSNKLQKEDSVGSNFAIR